MNDKEYEMIGESIWNTYKNMAYLVERLGQEKIKRRLARTDITPEETAALERRQGELGVAREKRRSETSPKADIEVSKEFHRDTTTLPHKETPDQEKARVEGYKSKVRVRHQKKRTERHEARRGKSGPKGGYGPAGEADK